MAREWEARTSASLLERLRHHPADASAWEVFVHRYAPAIYGWCQTWGLQEADAEDVTQQVLYRFAQHLRTFVYDASRSFRGWLKTVARNAWSDLIAQQQRATPGAGDSDQTAALGSAEARDSLEQHLDSLFDLEVMEEAMARVQARVEPRTWEAFRLLALEGRAGADVAGELGLKVATAFKARSKVQKMIQEQVSWLEGTADTPCPRELPG